MRSAVAWECAVVSRRADAEAEALCRAAAELGIRGVESLRRGRLYFVNDLDVSARSAIASGLLFDPLTDDLSWSRSAAVEGGRVVEVLLRPGVTDPVAAAVRRGAGRLGLTIGDVATGWRFELIGPITDAEVDLLVTRLLANDVIETATIGLATPSGLDDAAGATTAVIPIRSLGDDDLLRVGAQRRLSMDVTELQTIRSYFAAEGRDPTDVELEALAQTWSEHCNHKTFRATLVRADGTETPSLLHQLRHVTDTLARPWVRSAFVDNAGIIGFDDAIDITAKAETHNHPSAIEPFGGANTGVGGVVRDVLGVSSRPVALTDVLCFGPLDLPLDQLPDGTLHPLRIRSGVIAGVADYGNKLGVPTLAGAIVHDPGYVANPLVFCGAFGALPRDSHRVGAAPADRVIVIGGRTGRDGIRGATFSSMEMDATTGQVAGASVQIGDPVVEQGLIEVVVAARDAGLYSAITDCGAGGLSSAVGEMAAVIGADVELNAVPVKYAGLEPWEVWLSEAQERMVLAVPAPSVTALQAICDRFEVELSDIGEFTGTGRLVVRSAGVPVVDLDTTFLHDGCPRRRHGVAEVPVVEPTGFRNVTDPTAMLLRLLSLPSLRSNLDVVHGYDHEVLGGTAVRPYLGAADDGPGDAAVIRPVGADPSTPTGLAIGIGVNARYGAFDARSMAEAVVDEAIRNVVAVGADPDRVALLDNFSWGDVRDPGVFAQLVAAVEGCCAAALAHGAPYVSGKDSLNNAFVDSNGVRRSIPPTLVIHAVGVVPDLARTCTSDLKRVGDIVLLSGATRDELRGGHLDVVLGIDGGGSVPGFDADAPRRYRELHRFIRDGLVTSIHDLSEGGLAVAAAEMAIGGRLGLDIDVDGPWVPALFSESSGRFLLTCRPEAVDAFDGLALAIGTVVADGLTIRTSGPVVTATIDALRQAWAGHVA